MKPTHEQWLEALEAIINERCWILVNGTRCVNTCFSLAAAVGYATAVNAHMSDRESGTYDAVVVAGDIIVWPADREGVLIRPLP